jgi:alpha-ketoglutarate-dependent taurine dioxygenase
MATSSSALDGIAAAGRRPANFPRVIQHAAGSANLAMWIGAHTADLDELLAQTGAILFRGFAVRDAQDLSEAVSAYSPNIMRYAERSTPRSYLGHGIFTSTEYPAHSAIPLHNENSYAAVFPRLQWFCCLVPAQSGGGTTLADGMAVFESIGTALRTRIEKEGVLYIRNFHPHVDLDWRDAFQVADRAQLEEVLQRKGIRHEWISDSQLRTLQLRPGVLVHPRCERRVWFNQAHLFNELSLAPELLRALRRLYGDDDLPRTTRFGGGGRLSAQEIADIESAYARHTHEICWQSGDVVLVDNMRIAHGRAPYSGERKVLVAMAAPARVDALGIVHPTRDDCFGD